MPDPSVPPGTYAGQARSPIVWAYLCPPCGGYAPIAAGRPLSPSGYCDGCGSHCPELHRFPALIDSAAGCGCRLEHPQVTGDLTARPVLDDSERHLIGEARRQVTDWHRMHPGQHGVTRALADHAGYLLDLLGKIAPKESDDD